MAAVLCGHAAGQETAIQATRMPCSVLPGRMGNVSIVDGQLYCYASGLLLVAQRQGSEVVGFEADTLYSRLGEGVDYVVKHPTSGDVYFTSVDKKGRRSLYCCRNDNGRLKKAKRVRTGRLEATHPVFTTDGGAMVFSAQSAYEGRGGYDLWIADRQEEKWSEPRNLGSRINSTHDEVSPTVSGDYLFFASAGHESEAGRLDLYALQLTRSGEGDSTRQTVAAESLVQHLPMPLNSEEGDDFDLAVDSDQGCGYWVSRRLQSECDSQLYSFRGGIDGVRLWGIVSDVEERKMADVEVVVMQNGTTVCRTTTNGEGRYECYLPSGQYYEVQFRKEGYFVEFEVVNTLKKPGSPLITEERRDAAMNGLAHQQPIYYDDLFGPGADLELSDFGRERLASLVSYLTDNPRSRVRLTLVSDLTEDAGFNLMLTSGRLQTLEGYLYERIPTSVALDFANGCAGSTGCNTATERVRLTVVIE